MRAKTTTAGWRRRVVGAAVAVAAAAAVGGCASDGLSPRESTQDYANTLYDVPPPPRPPAGGEVGAGPATRPAAAADVRVAPPVVVTGPVSVAVVQLGEVAPPEAAVRAFAGRSDLFARVDPLAARGKGTGTPTDDDMAAYRAAAANLGDDYVLVYGGTLDHRHVTTPLSVFDLTIVGAFVVPSEYVAVSARAAGSMVDVRTGRVAFAVTADAEAHTLQSAATAGGVGESLADAVRQDLELKLVGRTEDRLAGLRRRRPPAGRM